MKKSMKTRFVMLELMAVLAMVILPALAKAAQLNTNNVPLTLIIQQTITISPVVTETSDSNNKISGNGSAITVYVGGTLSSTYNAKLSIQVSSPASGFTLSNPQFVLGGTSTRNFGPATTTFTSDRQHPAQALATFVITQTISDSNVTYTFSTSGSPVPITTTTGGQVTVNSSAAPSAHGLVTITLSGT